ncbi:hypothetical protein [Mycolicibacterium setense]
MPPAATPSVIPMALGCLSLIPQIEPRTLANRRDREWWQQTLFSGLGLLSSITDLDVQIRDVYASRDLSTASLPDNFRDDDDTYRNLDLELYGMPGKSSHVKFVVTIPKRMHSELTRDRLSGFAEKIEFRTIYGFRGPVTFIRPLEGQEGDVTGDFAGYAVLLREFLKRELPRYNSPIRIASVGPSPFHAQMVVSPKTASAPEADHCWERTAFGYDRIAFFYDSEKSSSDDAYNEITATLVDPFATYYFLVRAKYRRMDTAADVSSMASQLMAVHQGEGVRAWITKTVRSGRMARDLLLDTLTAKYSDSTDRTYLKEEVLGGVSTSRLPVLEEICAHEVEETFVGQLGLAEDIARTLEGGRVSQYEVLVVSASTLLGALAGAIAALIAG